MTGEDDDESAAPFLANARHTVDCVYTGQAAQCDGECQFGDTEDTDTP